MVRAVTDLGSNSLKCVIARVEGQEIEVLAELRRGTRLGGEIWSIGAIGEAAIMRAILSLREFRKCCDELGVEQAVCLGTETLRRASDSDMLELHIQAEIGWRLHTLSPEDEARLTFLASAPLAKTGEAIRVIDPGGASTEFSSGVGGRISNLCSLPLGALTLTREFLRSDPCEFEELAALQRHIRKVLGEVFPAPETRLTIASGGTAVTLATVARGLEKFSEGVAHGFCLEREEVLRQIELYGWKNLAERREIKGLSFGRAEIILAGAVLLAEIMAHLGIGSVLVSERGLRHAILTDEEFWGNLKPLPVCTRHHLQLV